MRILKLTAAAPYPATTPIQSHRDTYQNKMAVCEHTLYYCTLGIFCGVDLNGVLGTYRTASKQEDGGSVAEVQIRIRRISASDIKVGDVIAERWDAHDDITGGSESWASYDFHRVKKLNAKNMFVEPVYHDGRPAELTEPGKKHYKTKLDRLTAAPDASFWILT